MCNPANEMAETVPLFAALLSISTADRYPALNLSPQQQKQRILEVLVDQVAGSRGAPAGADDLRGRALDRSKYPQRHSAFLWNGSQRLPILMLLTFRPDYRPPWPGHAHVTQLSLSRLSRRQGTEILGRLAGGKGLPIEIMDQILLTADGVPLFLEELTKTVLESGPARRCRGSLRAVRAAAALGHSSDASGLAHGPARPPAQANTINFERRVSERHPVV